MNIGFIGFGEASSKILLGLSNEKFDDVYYAYDIRNEAFENVNQNVERCMSINELVEKANYIFTAVPGKYDYDVFQKVLSCNLKDKLIMDISTTNPKTKNEISLIAYKNKAYYVDVAVLGSIPKLLHKTPMILSGAGSSLMKETFSKYNMNLSIVEGDAGKASTIKLCRSIFMKGLPALAIETKKVCEKYSVTEDVFSSIYENLKNQSFEQFLNILVDGAYKHSIRQRDELLECLELEKNVDIEPNMTNAAVKMFNCLIDENRIFECKHHK